MGTTTAENAQHEVSFDEVHKAVVDIIIEVVGREFYEESEIDLDSTFAQDVELESTELLEISEKLIETYEDVDFMAWIGDMDLEQIVEISLRDFIDFIVSSHGGRELGSQ